MIKLDIKIYDKIKDDYFNEIIKEMFNEYEDIKVSFNS